MFIIIEIKNKITKLLLKDEKKIVDEIVFSEGENISQKLLPNFDRLLRKNKLTVEDIDNTRETPKPDNLTLKIIDKLVSFGFQKSAGRKIDTLIVHSSYDAIGADPYDVNGVIAEYKSYGVAPHYLIDRKGNVYQLVSDQNIAYHAGESQMPDGRTGVNAFSLGVEMLTTKTDKLTQAQYDSLNALIVNLKGKYKLTNILGHNQIAPGRKDDPWNFEWSKVKK